MTTQTMIEALNFIAVWAIASYFLADLTFNILRRFHSHRTIERRLRESENL